ncbi:MAG: MazG-like family protein [Flavobacteriaceae bacterium]|nr:MazG-like family protein [Flavobacteriaceae bacterium]
MKNDIITRAVRENNPKILLESGLSMNEIYHALNLRCKCLVLDIKIINCLVLNCNKCISRKGRSDIKSIRNWLFRNEQPSVSFEDLEKKVISWANDRKLINKDFEMQQTVKIAEELGELARSIIKNDLNAKIDAIGDLIITIITLSAQNNLSIIDCLNSAYEEIKNRTGNTINGSFIKDNSN